MLCFKKIKKKTITTTTTRNTWYINIDDIVISKLIETKTNFKYWIWHLDKVIRPLVLILPKVTGCVNTHKDKDRNNKLMSFCINDEKLLQKY